MALHLRRSRNTLVAAACAVLAITGSIADAHVDAGRSKEPIPLDDASMIVEVNATEGDAGIQVFFDGEPWDSMTISGPRGTRSRKLLRIDAAGRLRGHGLTELFSESSEPPFSELPLATFKRRFPEGVYRFAGHTIEGTRLVGTAKLSHDIPRGPRIVAPAEGALIDRNHAVASWRRGRQPARVEIVAYRAIVERDHPVRVFSVDLPASVTSVTIPPEFLQRNAGYMFELQAIEASGNITFSETHFEVAQR
jgi:hypothetical protein